MFRFAIQQKSIKSPFIKISNVRKPQALWNKFTDDLSEDILPQKQLIYCDIFLNYYKEIYNFAQNYMINRILAMGGDELPKYRLPHTIGGGGN